MGENMQIKLNRDSVCMADDLHVHARVIEIASVLDTYAAVMDIAKSYLPTIAGHGHTWDCLLDGENIAQISGNCAKITPLAAASARSESCHLYFKYHSAAW